jgi:hypothetical protein
MGIEGTFDFEFIRNFGHQRLAIVKIPGLLFCKRTWLNPDVEVTPIDFVADRGKPFLVALRAE